MAKETVVRNNIWKWLILGLIAAVSIYVCNPPKEKLRFGLDLKGGTSFTLGVDTDQLAETIIAANPELKDNPQAVQAKIDETLNGCDDRIIQVIRRRVDSLGTNEPVIQGMKDHRLLVQLPGVGEEVRITVSAKSFLYHQVRNFAGALVKVGLGKWSVADFEKAFKACDRTKGAETAPAEGLCFMKVEY